jgi:nitroreductase
MQYNLSEITDLIRSRRSIAPEHFSGRKVHREQVELLLNNAIWAPNHGLTQPWRFIVMNGTALEELAVIAELAAVKGKKPEEINEKKVERMLSRMRSTSVAIAVIYHPHESGKVPEWEELAAIGAAVQNLHLTAHAYGLAGFWSTPKVMQTDEIRAHLNLEDMQSCKGIFYIGYPTEGEYKSHRRPLEYCTKWRWDE